MNVIRFSSVEEIVRAFPDESSCMKHLEALRWPAVVLSPFNRYSKVYKCKGYYYRCSQTGKYFNAKTGTVFHNSKIDLQKWFIAIWIITIQKKEISSISLGKDLGVTQKSAWFMIQRIKKNFGSNLSIKSGKSLPSSEQSLPMIEWLQLLKK